MKSERFSSRWGRVDEDPAGSVDYLDTVTGTNAGQAYKQQTLQFLELHIGDHVLDVGCGTGDDVRVMAKLVGSTGHVVGVDNSAMMIAECQKRSEGLTLPVEFRVGDAHDLDFADGAFSRCRADRVFQHLENPRLALAEMVRVARSGGRIVVIDPDWETLVVDAPDAAVTRAILHFRCDKARNGWIGRSLPGLFRAAGLTHIAVTPTAFGWTDYAIADKLCGLAEGARDAAKAGVVPRADAAAWVAGLEEASRAWRFFASLTLFLVAGRKP